MKLVSQRFRDGLVQIMDVPAPALRPGTVLVRTACSAISPGTEGSKVLLGRKTLLAKARQRPDQVALVVNTLKEQGPAATLRRVRRRLDFPEALGYSSSGVVIAAPAQGATDLPVGTRVACAGPGAYHAEVALVARTFCVPVPDKVSIEDAAFTGLGAIATEAIHQSGLVVGESVGVIGLGLIGQLVVQIAKAAGARVTAIDVDPTRVETAVKLGADVGLVRDSPGLEAGVGDTTRGRGLDAVLVTAATQSNDPLVLAGRLAAENGRVVLVGAVDIELPRKDYYEKQLRFQISRSFGAGSYDVSYQRGQDYASGLTRWTARTNMETFLNLVADAGIRIGPLITHRFPIQDATQAYELIAGGGAASLGIVITYPDASAEVAVAPVVVDTGSRSRPIGERPLGVGFIGAGSFAQAFLLPNVAGQANVRLTTVVTGSGTSAATVRSRYGFARAGSHPSDVIDDPETDCVFIATRHELHAQLAVEALSRSKHVFVEKPIARNREELTQVAATVRLLASTDERCPILSVGYNRRFAPLAVEARQQIAQVTSPLLMHYRINAGALPADSWIREAEQGGRIVGEACHFVDLLTYLCGALPVRVYAEALPAGDGLSHENIQALIRFADGSVGHVEYSAVGDRALPRERIEVMGGQLALVIDNFRKLTISARGRTRSSGGWVSNLGHAQGVRAFLAAVTKGLPAPIPFEQIWAGMMATILIEESIAADAPVSVPPLP